MLLVETINQHGRPMAGLSSPPPKKKGTPTNMGDPWLVCCTAQREPRSGWLPPLPTVGSVVFCVLCWGWGSFVVSVFGGSRLGRCQSTSRHGTCRCYAQSARWCTGTQLRAAHCNQLLLQLSNWHAYSCRHIRNGTSCSSPHGQINCPADTVPSYRWRNCDCHQTFRKSVPQAPGHPRSSAPADHWPWQCNAPIAST